MKINVTENKVSIKEEQILNENEYNIHKIQFDFSSEYTDDLVKVALFSIDNHTYKKIISNNECDIPPEVLTQRGYSILGVYAYKTEQDTLVLRYSPSPTRISVYDGSYKADAENSEPITPSEIEQYQQILQNSLQQFQNQYNALVEETEGDIQAIEDELQRKVDEGYFDGEDGFSPIAKVIQKSNGATIEIEDKNGKTTADVLNGEDGYTPVRGLDYWTEEDKQEVEEEATQQIEGKIEEYNENAAEKLNQYNQNSVQKTNDYNTNASQKVESFNINASSKLSEYNSNAETKKSAYDENATQKTNSFNTNATQKTEDFDAHTEEIQDNIEKLQTENERLKATLPTTGEVTGQDITLDKTAELEFKKPPLPMGNSEQESTTGKNLLDKQYFENGSIDGTTGQDIANDYNGRGNNYIPVLPNTTYTLSANTIITNLRLSEYTNDKTHIQRNSIDRNSKLTITTTANTYFLRWSLNYNNSTVVTQEIINSIDLQLEQGSTKTDYEKYTGGEASPNPQFESPITNVTGDVEVKVQNKNLFDKANATVLYSNTSSTIEHINNGIKVIAGQTTDTAFVTTKVCDIENLINKTVTVKGNWTGSNSGTILIGYCNKDGSNRVTLGQITTSINFTSITIPEGKEDKVLILWLYTNGNINGYVDYTNVQVEYGSTATEYVEHKEQTFTFPLGNEKLMLGDYLADDGIHHVRGQEIIDENSNVRTSAYGVNSYVVNTTNRMVSNETDILVISTHFKGISANQRGTAPNVVYNNTANQIEIRNTEFETLNQFKTWLENNNVTIEYILEQETIVPYTSAQQEVYNQIKQALSYEEQTNISSNTIALFNVEAYQSTKLVLEEMATAIVALGGV